MQTPEEAPRTLEVPLAALVELAVEWWRLDRWAHAAAGPEWAAAASRARHAARRLAKFLRERELAVADLTGRAYEPGLAVEVLDVITDGGAPPGAGVIEEMVSPVVLWRGTVVRHGQAIIRRNF